jgi:hypothetical protein
MTYLKCFTALAEILLSFWGFFDLFQKLLGFDLLLRKLLTYIPNYIPKILNAEDSLN